MRHARKATKHARKQDKAKDMLKKAIKHVMKQDKANGIDCSLKATSTPLKPQIQGPKTKERKKSARTLPLYC